MEGDDSDKLKGDLIRRAFFNTSVADVYRIYEQGLILPAYTMLFCGINVIAGMEDRLLSGLHEARKKCETCNQPIGQTGDSKLFQRWVDKWIKKDINKKTNAHFLYALRNSLVHARGWSGTLQEDYNGYQLGHDQPDKHWEQMKPPDWVPRSGKWSAGYILNLESLLAEFVIGAKHFFDWAEPQWTTKELVFNELKSMAEGTQVQEDKRVSIQEAPRKYQQMHFYLYPLDIEGTEATAEFIALQMHPMIIQANLCKHGQKPRRF
jgi:hypothetical protein